MRELVRHGYSRWEETTSLVERRKTVGRLMTTTAAAAAAAVVAVAAAVAWCWRRTIGEKHAVETRRVGVLSWLLPGACSLLLRVAQEDDAPRHGERRRRSFRREGWWR